MADLTFDKPGAVLTASGNSAYAPDLARSGYKPMLPDPNNLSVNVNVTAATGTTPSLTIEVQWSQDGTTFASAATPDVFTAITATGAVVKSFQAKGRYARLKYTITGTTPSFTATVTAYAA